MPLPVTCPACGKSFSISDEIFEQKIKGRVVTVKCKQCQSPIRVDGTKGLAGVKIGPPPAPAAAAPSAPAAAGSATSAAGEPAAQTRAEAEPAAAQEPEAKRAADTGGQSAAAQPSEEAPAQPAADKATPPAAAEPAAVAAPPAAAQETTAASGAEAPLAVAPQAATAEAAPVAASAAADPGPAPVPKADSAAARPDTSEAERAAPAAKPDAPKAALGTRATGAARTFKAADRGGATPGPSPSAAKGAPASPAAAPAPAAPAPAAPAPAAPAPAAPQPVVEPAAAPPAIVASSTLLFAVDLPGGDRELTEAQIAEAIARGEIAETTLVWREGMQEWLEVKKVAELARHLKPVAPKSDAKASAKAEQKAPATTPKPDGVATKSEAKPGARPPATATPAARFRPRQPTIPMGMLPDQLLAEARAQAERATAAAAAMASEAAAAQALAPAVTPDLPPVGSPGVPAAPVLRSPPLAAPSAVGRDRDAPSPRPPAPAPRALPEAKPAANLKDTPKLGAKAPIPVRPVQVPDMSDEEPTVMRPFPFGELDVTPGVKRSVPPTPPAPRPPGPPPRAPEAAPAAAAASSPWGAAAAQLLKPPARRASSADLGTAPADRRAPVDTYRATPEAKLGWFPESDSAPPPPAPGSSPFPVGAPRAPLPSSPFGPSAPGFGPPFAGAGGGPAAAIPPATPSGTAPATSFDEVPGFKGQNRSKLWILIAVVAVVVIAVVVAVMSRGDTPPPAAPAPESHASPGAAPEPGPPTGDTANNPAPPNAGSEPTQPQPQAAPQKGPGGGFADLFAEGAKHAQGSGQERFDAGAAKNALDAQLQDAARCREPGGPTGLTQVAVTFAPSGVATSALISEPPFANTSVGTCIVNAMKRARIRPFSGAPSTVSERISIR